MPPHASSLELLARVRRPQTARSLLDVGCGSGCQAILLSPAYERAQGIDLDPRAVAYARLNARLCGQAIAFEARDALQPEPPAWDHVVFNTPDQELARAFAARSLAALVSPGGLCQLWVQVQIQRKHETPSAAVGDLLAGLPSGFDIELDWIDHGPFRWPRNALAAGKPPPGTLLVSHPGKLQSTLQDLRARDIVEIGSAVIHFRATAAIDAPTVQDR
jgi:SAM-dependent methyltransferase